MPARKRSAGKQKWILAGRFRHEADQLWVADLPPEVHGLTDNNAEPYRSRLQLLEGNRLLGPAHSLHEAISKSGSGSYSFWQSVLYFSTSDGSDPNDNGRKYAVALPGESQLEWPSAPSWKSPPRPLRCAIIGLGNRGVRLGSVASSLPGVEIAWIVDNSKERLANAASLFGIGVRVSDDVHEALADNGVDIIFVTVPDHAHRQVAEAAFRAGKHVFLEKPLATTVTDARAILSAWQESGRVLQLGYVLRQAPFYAAIRDVVRRGLLGPVRMALLSDQLQVRHGGTFMRRWHADSRYSGGLLVHKGCHDLDILCWLLDARPLRIASFGGAATFNRTPPAPFCSQCAERAVCPYADDALYEKRSPPEVADPTAYGLDRCVFHPDKDIVDNQVVSFELDTGTRGSFSLAMQGPSRSGRRISLMGDMGTLDGIFEDGRFDVRFTDEGNKPLTWTADNSSRGGHGGGDRITMLDFLNACAGRGPLPVVSPEEALRGLVFALAAEQARKTQTVVTLASADFGLA